MISIIIPVYNVEKYLPQCLDSILVQTYNDFEVILVDDGSKDNSGNICDEYAKKDKRFYVIHQQNSGVSTARNNGIALASGEWIVFIDSDDFVNPDFLESFEIGYDDADVVIQGIDFYDDRTSESFKKIEYDRQLLAETNLKYKISYYRILSNGYPYAKAIKKKLLTKNNLKFDTTLSFHEDHILVFQLLNLASNIRLSDCTAYKYRCFHSAMTLSSKRHSWQNLNNAADGMLKCLDNMNCRFLESGSQYSREIYSFAYYPKISAVAEEMRSVESFKERKSIYNCIINKNELKLFYHPKDFKGKLIKRVMLCNNYFLTDAFFKILIKYQDRNL